MEGFLGCFWNTSFRIWFFRPASKMDYSVTCKRVCISVFTVTWSCCSKKHQFILYFLRKHRANNIANNEKFIIHLCKSTEQCLLFCRKMLTDIAVRCFSTSGTKKGIYCPDIYLKCCNHGDII